MILRKATDPHQGSCHRNLGALRKLSKLLGGLGRNDAATAVDHRLLSRGDQPKHFLKSHVIGEANGVVPTEGNGLWEDRLGLLVLDIFGDVHQHGTRTSTLRDMKRLLDDPWDVVDIPDQVAVLHHGERHPEEISLLEGPAPDHLLRHLAGNRHHRNRIHVGVGYTGYQIGGAGPGGRHADTSLAGDTGISLRGKTSTLLMTREDRPDLLRLRECLMDRHGATTRVGKDKIDSLSLQ